MSDVQPRLPEQFHPEDDFNISELAAGTAGAVSPYGDLEFPLPANQLTYVHPSPADRPHLANGR